jgi:small subunit ribosomal protein S17
MSEKTTRTVAKKAAGKVKAPAAAKASVPATASTSAAAAAPVTAPVTASAATAKTLTGKVISNKMQKTVSVEIERLVRHETYGKYLRRSTKLMAHDENGECREGDMVTIAECRPISRHKSWRVVRVVERAAQ